MLSARIFMQVLRNDTNTNDATRANGNGDVVLHMTPGMDALDTWTAPTITEIAPSNVN